MRWLALVAMLAACGSSKPKAPAPAPASPAQPRGEVADEPICAAMAARYYAPALARAHGTPQHELFALQRDAMIDSCRAHAWPQFARACFAERTITDNTCHDRLAPAHREDWRQRSAAALRTFEGA